MKNKRKLSEKIEVKRKLSEKKRKNIHRTLDDTPLVTPANWNTGPRFAEAYETICEEIGARLVPPCPIKTRSSWKNTFFR